MSTIDLSRLAIDPRKHYAGVRMQQGRVLTDDDFNEAAALDAEDMRRTRVHAIGACGAPDAGFLPKDFALAANGRVDFKLSAGTLYLGGLRLELGADEAFQLQKDWLNFDPLAAGPGLGAPAPPANGATRTDLVWIEAWQQPVTAVEDSELFEVALGGPDTSTRWRTMRRVHVAEGVTQGECADAWAALSAVFTAQGLGSMNAEMELATQARLSVSFNTPPVTGDLCAPPQAGGYLGAENQAIRVQMVDATRYTWGFDNAAPLYRVQLSPSNGQLVKLKLLNPPRDAVHWPLRGQTVELLPWSAALANGERIAEVQGHLCKVQLSYNPDDGTLEIDVAPPAGFGTQWQARSDKAEFFDGTAEQNFFFLRVWMRGDDIASPAAIPIATAALGNTGLSVAFSGAPLRAGDHWIIAARPAAPDKVVPWRLALAAGAPPHGIRRFRAPLALVQWSTAGGVSTGRVVHDCRPPFLPLTRLRGCCSVTVGDGSQSFGMFRSIQAAVEALPPSGGTVCILPGRYEETVVLKSLRNVTLHGCGPRSRIVAPKDEGEGSTALWIAGCNDVAVESLALEGGGPVVMVQGSAAVRIATCLVQMRDLRDRYTAWAALFVEGESVLVEDNVIEPLPDVLEGIFLPQAEGRRAPQALSARGGIQLAGGCEHVRLVGNVIAGGTGNGITLGSLRRIGPNDPDGRDVPDIDIDDDPCAPCDPVDGGVPPDATTGPVRYESTGDLYDIEIEDNLIVRHGASGISVVRYFAAPMAGATQGEGMALVTVHGLRIAHNRILGCLRRAVAQAPQALQLLVGYGGIALAFVTELAVEGNHIAHNGRDWRSPVCGLFVLAAWGLTVERNRIQANGVRGETSLDGVQPGIRAGVHVWLALGGASGGMAAIVPEPKLAGSGSGSGSARPDCLGALRVHGNRIEQPLGRALLMLGAGAMHVSDNRLFSQGTGMPATDPLASTVLLANFGQSKEWTTGLLAVLVYLLSGNTAVDANRQSLCGLSKEARTMPALWPDLPTGKLLFNDNQVIFQMRDAPRGLDLATTLLMSLDDVSACANQFEAHTEQRLVLANLLALGSTLRCCDNRLAETWGRALLSLFSMALLNTAADNQSTHCISAVGLRRAVHHNLALAEAFCPNACENSGDALGRIVQGVQLGVFTTH